MKLRLIAAIGAAVMGLALLAPTASADGRYGDRHGSYSRHHDDCRGHKHYGKRGHHHRHADRRDWRRDRYDRHDRRDHRWRHGDRRWDDRDHRRGRGRDRDRDYDHHRHDGRGR